MAGEAVAAQPQERPAGFLDLMRNRNYALLWSGQLISEIGNRFHWVAVSLWVYAVTGSASAVSFAIASMFAGGLLVSLWAGALVDRLNRRTILIVSDVVRAGLVFLIPSLINVNIWLVYADLVLISFATAFFRPAILALVPQIVPRRQLLQANSFFTAMDTATEIGGPIVAGLIAQTYSYAPLLYADGATYLISALCIAGMSVPAPASAPSGPLSLRSIWEGAMGGLRYVRTDRLQWALFLLIFPAAIVGSGLNALQTPLAKGPVGVTDFQFGVFQGVWGSGFVVASLLLGWFGAKQRRSLIMLVGFFLAFVSTAFMGLTKTVEMLLLAGFLVGFANTLYYVGTTTVLMEHSPEGIIGRVLSTRQLAISAIRVVSPLVFGALAEVESIGIRNAVVGMAVLGTIGTGAVVATNPVVRQFDASGTTSQLMTRAWEAFTGLVHPDFEAGQQRRLSFGLTAIVILTWAGLLLKARLLGLFCAVAVGILWGLGKAVKSFGLRG